MEATFNRLVELIQKNYDTLRRSGASIPFALRTVDGLNHTFGDGEPAFALIATRRSGLAALSTMDLSRIAEAYVSGALDLEGDVRNALSLRGAFQDRHPVAFLWRFLQPLLFGQVGSDGRWISRHYDHPPEFWLAFLDSRHRCYSHGFFASDDEPLEQAIGRKLEYALDAIDAKPGDRVLDIGGGWGAMTEFGGERGVRVVSLTISQASRKFIQDLIEQKKLPSEVRLEHFFEHTTTEPYDGIVNLGVTEHLPDYRQTLRKYLELLKPGGKVYLDASADRQKNSHSKFLEKYLFPGNGSLVCMHEYLAELARTPLQLLGVYDDRHNYHLTTRRWAEALDRSREFIERSWGTTLYRSFQLYLWGSADAFEKDMAQAYHWVIRKPT